MGYTFDITVTQLGFMRYNMVGRWEIPELLFLMGTSWNN